jgi:hypothetical protein
MGSTRATTVFGIYSTIESAETALDDLVNSGFTCSDISILLPDNESTRAFAVQKNTKPSEAATAGATTGGIVGGGLGLLAILGELAIPGVGPMIAGGPILGTLMGVAVGGTLGGLVGALIGMGIPEFEAKLYEGAVKEGGALLSINCNAVDQVHNAKSSLERTGARDVAYTSEAISKDISGNDSDGGDVFEGDELRERGWLAESPS